MKTMYFGVIGNRDHIKIDGDKRPFWEFLDEMPDGWLTSLVYRREDVPSDRPMIFDCGAWSYRNEEIPKKDADHVLSDYLSYAPQGSFLIAPDHMLIDGCDVNGRTAWNMKQAARFLHICPIEYKPMAVAHGMDLDSRVSNAKHLASLGYEAIAIGGIAARASQKKLVVGMVEEIRKAVPGVWLHVLGLSSPDYMRNWSRIGVESADGSSHFKQAFTGGAFFTVNGDKLKKHKAIRPGEDMPEDMPSCDCLACSKLRDQGIDTRSYGSNENNMGRAAHNLNMLMTAQKNAMRRTVVLVACCGKKSGGMARAEEMYQSPLFIKARKWAEQNGDEWHILSAEYGLVDPSQEISSYDKTLSDMSRGEVSMWNTSVLNSLSRFEKDKIIVLAGKNYCGWIPDEWDVSRPMEGLGIGQQLSWLDKNTKTEQMELV